MKKFTFLFAFFAFLMFMGTSNAQDILAVDRDGSADLEFTDCWPDFQAALDAGGYTYTYYEVTNLTGDGPDLATMMDYDIIIWFTGESWDANQTMSDNDEANLASYLDAGGNLFFSGQDWLWDRYPSAGTLSEGDFPYDYFGLTSVAQDNWVVETPNLAEVDGEDGSLAEGYNFFVEDIFTTSKDGLFIDELTGFMGTGLFNVIDPTPEGICGVQYESGDFKTVFSTVSFAGITVETIQADLMADIIDWFTGGGMEIPPYFDPFEDYTADDYLALQNPLWTTWSGAPGTGEDAMVVTDAAYSGTQSVKVEGSTTDLILPFGDKTSGKYIVSMDIMVETGMGGYYNILHEFAGGDSEWAMEVYFASDGTGELYAGNNGDPTPFNYPNGEWFNARVEIDLDMDHATYLVDDEYVYDWQWSLQSTGDPGMNQLGAMDIFASAPAGDDVGFYFDNMYYFEDNGCEFFEEYMVGEYIGLQSPFWTTWSEDPGSGEDAMVDFVDPYQVLLIEGATDLVHNFSYENLTENSYLVSFWFMVADGHTGYWNLQKDVVPGVEWGVQMQWESDEIATLDAGEEAAATFNYNFDEWYYIEVMVDLDNDIGEVWIDDDMLHTWQWTLGTFGDPGALTLGGVNLYAWEGASTPMFYFDDMCFDQLTYVGQEEPNVEKPGVRVYPNPVRDNVYLLSQNNITEVHVFNNIGQLVASEKFDGKKVNMNLDHLKTGVYMLEVMTSTGKESTKLIIE